MNSIRCISCGSKVNNSIYFKCDDCREMDKRKKHCVHEPETLDYMTNCRICNKALKAVRWEEA